MKTDNVYYSGCLQKQTRDMLKQEDMLNHKPSAKTGGSFFSYSCYSQYQNTLPTQYFMTVLSL